MATRRRIRVGPKVLHRHHVGRFTFLRVSELVFVQGGARAVLGWIDVGQVRTPLYLCELDLAKLRRVAGTRNTYVYDEVTVDPRYENLEPAPSG
jgi:hypothetical protein